jgi:hypothetical protein
VAKCAANIMKVYFKNEKKPICIEIFIHSLKYINTFLILHTKCARKFVYVLQCAANRKNLRTTALGRCMNCRYSATRYPACTLDVRLETDYLFRSLELGLIIELQKVQCQVTQETLIFHSIGFNSSHTICGVNRKDVLRNAVIRTSCPCRCLYLRCCLHLNLKVIQPTCLLKYL